jgi:hypothetical protein
MKLPIKSIAAAVSLALISAAAHSQSATLGTTAPSTNGLYLSIWDTSTNSEIVNLNNAYSTITAASGALGPNSAGGAFVMAANPDGTGNVLQLNFGVIPGFSSTFSSSDIPNTSYMVTAAVTGGAGTEGFEATSATTPITAYGGVNAITGNITGEIAAWQGDPTVSSSGYAVDTTNTKAWAVQSGLLNSGLLVSGQQFGGAVGTALGFYNVTTTAAHKSVITQYANATGNGFWFLSSSGDLTYNVPSASAPVPLPAAVWLLGSGLLGLAGIGRRRAAA